MVWKYLEGRIGNHLRRHLGDFVLLYKWPPPLSLGRLWVKGLANPLVVDGGPISIHAKRNLVVKGALQIWMSRCREELDLLLRGHGHGKGPS